MRIFQFNKYFISLYFIVCAICVENTFATDTFKKTYSHTSSGFDLGNPLQSPDLGYLFSGGLVDSLNPVNENFLLLKTDELGTPTWCTYYSTLGLAMNIASCLAWDGGIVMAGHLLDTATNIPEDYIVIKTDSVGNVHWSKAIGGINSDAIAFICQSQDSGYVIAGNSSNFTPGTYPEINIVKLDLNGNKIWSRALNHSFGISTETIKPTYDGGYILAGTHSLPYAILVIKTDSLGIPEWSKTYHSTMQDWAYDIIQSPDSGFVVLGVTRDGDDCTLLKIDPEGNVEWIKNISNNYGSVIGYDLELSQDNSILMAGSAPDSLANFESFILKISLSGMVQWAGSIDYSATVLTRNFIQLQDGSFLFINGFDNGGIPETQILKTGVPGFNACGMNEAIIFATPISLSIDSGISWHNAADSIWNITTTLNSTNLNETILCLGTGIEKTLNAVDRFDIYPNPTSEYFLVRFNENNGIKKTIQIINALGQQVWSTFTSEQELNIACHTWPAGIYSCFISSDSNRISSKKIILMRD